MHCSFTLTRADFAALQKILMRRLTHLSQANSRLFISNLFIWIPLGIAFAAYLALFRKYPAMSYDLSVVATTFCLGITLVVAGAFYKRHVYRRAMLSPESWFLSEQTADLTPEGLCAQGTYGLARYPWSAFRHLAEDDRNLYLFIDNAQAFVLPKVALGSSDQVARIKAWLPT